MHHFNYRDDRLFAEDVDISAIADGVGTPFYCYSAATIRRHVRVFRQAFSGLDALIAYSVKANSNLSVLKLVREEGAGADVVSGGELARALEAGIAPAQIVFSGVGKTRVEMAAAIDAGIYQFNVESEPELYALNDVALSKNTKAPIALRINPDVSAGGHEKISTGKAEDKFGIAWSRTRELYKIAAALPGIDVKGVDAHIGSQIAELAPFEKAFNRLASLIAELRRDGVAIERLDLGGGLGISYGDDKTPPHPDEYAELIRRIAAPLDVQLIFEPGRMIVGNAGILVARVIYIKDGENKKFVIVDAGMNDLIRPALYNAFHAVEPVHRRPGAPENVDIVGPVCETGDRFAKSRPLAPMATGDLVGFMSAGAYGAVQASQYNSRPLAPEVLVDGDRFAVIRARPTYDDMVSAERAVDWRSPA